MEPSWPEFWGILCRHLSFQVVSNSSFKFACYTLSYKSNFHHLALRDLKMSSQLVDCPLLCQSLILCMRGLTVRKDRLGYSWLCIELTSTDKVQSRNKVYYSTFPEDEDRVRIILKHLQTHDVKLPDGSSLIPERFLQLGIHFGMKGTPYFTSDVS